MVWYVIMVGVPLACGAGVWLAAPGEQLPGWDDDEDDP